MVRSFCKITLKGDGKKIPNQTEKESIDRERLCTAYFKQTVRTNNLNYSSMIENLNLRAIIKLSPLVMNPSLNDWGSYWK